MKRDEVFGEEFRYQLLNELRVTEPAFLSYYQAPKVPRERQRMLDCIGNYREHEARLMMEWTRLVKLHGQRIVDEFADYAADLLDEQRRRCDLQREARSLVSNVSPGRLDELAHLIADFPPRGDE